MKERHFTPRNPQFKETILEKLKGQYFMDLVEFNLHDIEAGFIRGRMPIKQQHKQQHGFVHGGVISTVSDIVMGFAAYSLVSNDQGVVTANLSVDYLHPGIGDELIAEGWVEKAGSKLYFCHAKVTCLKGNEELIIATGRSIMAVVQGG